MTNRRDFKALVRARMEKTGERYTTARAHVLAAKDRPTVAEPLFGGEQPDLSAARNFCTRHGVAGPDGAPLTEAMAFGLAGGVGFLYGVFEYGDQPTMTIVCRNESMPDPFIEPLFSRVGLTVDISTTTSERKAAQTLDDEIAVGRAVLCTVGAGGLGYLGLPPDEAAAAPHVVGVVAATDEGYLVDDQTPAAHHVGREELQTARRLYRQAKHRMVSVSAATDVDWARVLPDAVAAGAAGYDRPPVPQFAANVGTRGLRKWADLLVNPSDKKRWTKVFAEGPTAALGLSRMVAGIEHDYTSPAAGRPLYARFLREAADVTGTETWRDAADQFDAAADMWRGVVATATAAHPNVERYVDAAESRAALIDAGPDADEMRRLRDVQDASVDTCDIDAAAAADAFAEISRTVASIADLEEAAIGMLV